MLADLAEHAGRNARHGCGELAAPHRRHLQQSGQPRLDAQVGQLLVQLVGGLVLQLEHHASFRSHCKATKRRGVVQLLAYE